MVAAWAGGVKRVGGGRHVKSGLEMLGVATGIGSRGQSRDRAVLLWPQGRCRATAQGRQDSRRRALATGRMTTQTTPIKCSERAAALMSACPSRNLEATLAARRQQLHAHRSQLLHAWIDARAQGAKREAAPAAVGAPVHGARGYAL